MAEFLPSELKKEVVLNKMQIASITFVEWPKERKSIVVEFLIGYGDEQEVFKPIEHNKAQIPYDKWHGETDMLEWAYDQIEEALKKQ